VRVEGARHHAQHQKRAEDRNDIDAVVARLRARGAELVGDVERYEDRYRLCYVRGPEGIIVELAQQIG
jgi:catechol 2,3-dioxygenase-like lactoylglutathione lyase family enzyme